MHIFVEYRKKYEVGIAITEVHDAVADFLHITNRLGPGRQRQMPARIVGDLRGIIKGITIGPDRSMTSGVTQDPVLLEIRDVPNLPKKGINRTQKRYTKLLVREIAHEIECACSSVNNQSLQIHTTEKIPFLTRRGIAPCYHQPIGFPLICSSSQASRGLK